MHARILMKREHRRSTFDLTLIPTKEEVKRYDPRSDGYCCTAEHFRPDLNSSPGTPWNKSAIAVFARSFIDSDEYECDDITLVKEVFYTHLRHLSRKYKVSIGAEADKTEVKKRVNRVERKRGVRDIFLWPVFDHNESPAAVPPSTNCGSILRRPPTSR